MPQQQEPPFIRQLRERAGRQTERSSPSHEGSDYPSPDPANMSDDELSQEIHRLKQVVAKAYQEEADALATPQRSPESGKSLTEVLRERGYRPTSGHF
jgi:hypothetical protein